MTVVVNKYIDRDKLYKEVSSFLVAQIEGVLKSQDFASVVLCGGRTPLNIYRELFFLLKSSSVDFNKVYFFFCDERLVSPSDNRSNYKLAKEELFEKLNIPLENIFPMVSDFSAGIEENKNTYVSLIEKFFRQRRSEIVFDIMLLGIGADGHTASLFPEDRDLLSPEMVRTVFPKKADPPVPRITLGIDIINHSRKLIFTTDNPDKQDIVEQVLRSNNNPKYPASFIDKEKASFYYLVKNNN